VIPVGGFPQRSTTQRELRARPHPQVAAETVVLPMEKRCGHLSDGRCGTRESLLDEKGEYRVTETQL